MSEDPPFWVRFRGVRGSVPVPGTETIRYGGNTACIEVRCGGERFIFDAGTGIRGLGYELLRQEQRRYHLLLTHTHLDHIIGFPFFKPAYRPDYKVTVWAGHLLPRGERLSDVLGGLMHPALFPVAPKRLNGCVGFRDFMPGETLDLAPGVSIRTLALNHPGGATGYRIDFAGHALCYITDLEHVPGETNEALTRFVEGADLMIYDAMLTDEEFPRFVNWGHSTWQEGYRLCRAAGVKRLALFHHDPCRTDPELDAISAELDRLLPGSFAAREGRTFHVDAGAIGADEEAVPFA